MRALFLSASDLGPAADTPSRFAVLNSPGPPPRRRQASMCRGAAVCCRGYVACWLKPAEVVGWSGLAGACLASSHSGRPAGAPMQLTCPMDKMAWRLGLVHSAGEAGPVPSRRGTGSRGSDAPTPATAKAAAHLASAPLHGRHVSSTPRQSGRGGMALRGGWGWRV